MGTSTRRLNEIMSDVQSKMDVYSKMLSLRDDLSHKHSAAVGGTVGREGFAFLLVFRRLNSPPEHWRREHILVMAKKKNIYAAISPDG